MLADLTIIPIGSSDHTSGTLAEVLKAIDSSEIAYQLTPTSTCLEGSWEKIMTVTRLCHEIARREHPHVVTTLRLEDHASTDSTMLRHNLDSVEEKAGRNFHTEPANSRERTRREAMKSKPHTPPGGWAQ
jgi:uncharacterized protein (TIGR00106 family)